MFQEVMEAMSSFRIDRQYVSFVTAETQPVYAVHHTENKPYSSVGMESDCESEMDYDEHIRKELFEKAESEAKEEAQQIIDLARSEADLVIESAKVTSEKIIKKAKSDAEILLEEAKKAGFMEGQKIAFHEAEMRKQEEREDYQKLVDQLKSEYSNLVDKMQVDIISLVMQIVKKIIHIKLEQSDEIFIGLVTDAMERLKQTGTIVIRVNSDDYNRYFTGKLTDIGINTGDTKIIVVEEQSYSRGDLVVESEGEMLDSSVSRQIELVEDALRNEGN